MGSVKNSNSVNNIMKAFLCLSALVAASSAAPSGPVLGYGGGQTSHQSVSRPYGEQRSIVQSKAFGAAHASVSQVDNSKGLSEVQPAYGANRPVAGGAYHAAPAYHAPVVHHAPADHAEPAYPDEPSPYTYTYAVADDYSNSNFNAAETGDGNAGYVADVTYEGAAVYPDAPAPYHAPAPVPA